MAKFIKLYLWNKRSDLPPPMILVNIDNVREVRIRGSYVSVTFSNGNTVEYEKESALAAFADLL